MVARRYAPDRGDIIWLDLRPTRGHEQRGRRPALVLSPKTYNEKTGLMLACPVTSQVKGYAFEVALEEGCEVEGVALADMVRSLDWRVRCARYAARAGEAVTDEVESKLRALIEG